MLLIDVIDLTEEVKVIVSAQEHFEMDSALQLDQRVEFVLISIYLNDLASKFLVNNFIFVAFLFGKICFYSQHTLLILNLYSKERIFERNNLLSLVR